MHKLGVVVNEGKELGGGLEELRAVLADLGHPDPAWYEVSKSKKAPKKIRKLVEEKGVDRVLMWGGDGTVRRAINTIIDEGYDHVSIGILPAGTGNLLATNLGIPIELRGAVEIAVNGDPRALDVGRMNGEHFAVMAGTGFDAMMIRDADDNDLKEKFGRAGYVWAGMRNTKIAPAHAEIEIDGLPWFTGDASCVIVGNVGTILGGVEAFPDASPTDGRLDVGVVQARTKSEWLRLLGRGIVGQAENSPLAELVTAESISVKLDRTMPWEVDGGDRDREKAFEIECLPLAIKICQPWQT